MPLITKDATITVKSDTKKGDPPGSFTALVSVFGNTDRQGDIVAKGAFTDTLAKWASSAANGRPLPVLWSHDWTDPFSVLGDVTAAEETDEGLLVTASLDLDNPKAAQVYNQMKAGRINQFSFSATTPDEPGAWSLEEDEDGNLVQVLKKLDLIEVGPCLRGANGETSLVSIKSADLPARFTPKLKAEGDGATAGDPADDDPDDDPTSLIASLDAILDQALQLASTAGDNPMVAQQVFALVTAADAIVDMVMDMLNIPDPDDEPGYSTNAAKALEAAGVIQKEGKVLASKHVDTLKDIHGQLGNLIDTVTTTSRPADAEDEPAKSSSAPTPRQQAKARLAELANPRKDQE